MRNELDGTVQTLIYNKKYILFNSNYYPIIQIMFSINKSEHIVLINLGERLKRRRLQAGEPQARTAARLGVSLPTYRKLEKGDPSTPIGTWIRALRLYGSLEPLDALLPESLFDGASDRQRAPRSTR